MFAAELRRAVLWLPVLFGSGIAVYFQLPEEPEVAWVALPLSFLILLVSGAAHRAGLLALLVCSALAASASGFAVAVAHTKLSPVVMIDRPMAETVEGRVLNVSRSASGAPRLLLEDVVIYGLPASATPRTIRVALKKTDDIPTPGERVRIYSGLSPPGGPVEPGGYDFRRHAYFAGLGAVGFAHGVVVPVPESDEPRYWDRARVWLAGVRHQLSTSIRDAIPGPGGAFAAAIIVGDRAYIDDSDAEALRTANLAHLLAISGLHMGILTGLVFSGLRVLLAMAGPVPLLLPSKKIAAGAALVVALGYLMLSGATVATQRAFVMVSVALIAVLFDRPAITLRALAVAALIILLIRPISLIEPGFQMSFAATCALVAGYEAVRDYLRRDWEDRQTQRRSLQAKMLRTVGVYFGGLIFTTILAGFATAPFAAYHFNRTAPYGLLANLAAVPVMGLVVAPSALGAALLSPFGWAQPAMAMLGQGISVILSVAHWVAALPGAVGYVPAFPASILVAVTLGGLWLSFWRGPWRLLGLSGFVLAGIVYLQPVPRPEVLVAPGGGLTGAIGAEGRAIDHETTRKFIASNWLRRDGDAALQPEAAARPGVSRGREATTAYLSNGWKVVVIRRGDDHDALCQERTLVLAFRGSPPEGECELLYGRMLHRLEGVAISPNGQGISITPARPQMQRPWSAP
ncbi:MAG: ComEC/Rec2 family competence protein [Pseudomonadota bacterium]